VLVVSNIDLTTDLPVMSPSTFLESPIKDFTLNINNDYRYLNPVIPSSENAIDAYRVPILLLRASKGGIPTLPYLVTGSVRQIMSEFDFPVVVFAVNPFSYEGFKVAKNRSALYRAVKSLSMHYKFDVFVQPLKGEMVSFKSFFGKCEMGGKTRKISEKVYEVFKIPICELHVQNIEKDVFLCALQPLRKEEISLADLEMICGGISQISKDGEFLVG